VENIDGRRNEIKKKLVVTATLCKLVVK